MSRSSRKRPRKPLWELRDDGFLPEHRRRLYPSGSAVREQLAGDEWDDARHAYELDVRTWDGDDGRDEMEPIDYAEMVAKFRGLIADHGTFAEKQLHEYVSGKARRVLTSTEKLRLTEHAAFAGAVLQKFDGLKHHSDPRVFRFPVKRRRGLPGRKQDKSTIDMFTRESDGDRERRVTKARQQAKRG